MRTTLHAFCILGPIFTDQCHLHIKVAAIASGVLGGIRGYTPYTNLRVFLTAYTHLSDHK